MAKKRTVKTMARRGLSLFLVMLMTISLLQLSVFAADDTDHDGQSSISETEDKKTEDNKSEDNKSENNDSEDNKSEDNNSEDSNSEDNNSEDSNSEDNNSEDNKSEDSNSEDNKSEGDKSEDDKSENNSSEDSEEPDEEPVQTVILEEKTFIYEPIVIAAGQTLTYDLNGFWLYAYVSGDTLFTVEKGGTLILNNSSPKTGGIFLNWYEDNGDGQAVSCQPGSILVAENVRFEGCCTDDRSGAAIYAHDAALTIEGCGFSYNECNADSDYSGGGAIYLCGDDLTATIDGCRFAGNGFYGQPNVGGGGAIYLEGGRSIRITDNVFDSFIDGDGDTRQNFSFRDGGSIYCRIPNQLTISGNTITDSYAVNNGGGIAIIADEGSDVVLADNEITENYAGRRGGGVYIIASSTGKVALQSGLISGNEADWGGGIDYSIHNMPTLELQNVIITGNKAPRGGGVWACPTAEVETYSTLGGAIYGNESEGKIESSINVSKPATLYASGDDVRYEALSDTDDEFATLNANVGHPERSHLTVSQRTLGGGLMSWYTDAPDDRYEDGDAPADSAVYTNAKSSFGLHGELSKEHQDLAKAEALLIIKDNIARTRGGGIATNSPLVIGEKNADLTVHVKKVWEGDKSHPDEVKIDLIRVDSKGNRVTLDRDVVLNSDNEWSAVFTSLPAEYTYDVEEHTVDGWTASTQIGEVNESRTIEILLTNTYKPTTGGGGGGHVDPKPPVDPVDPVDPPVDPVDPPVDIPDVDVPTTDRPDIEEPGVDIPDPEVPTTDLPDVEVPKTGDSMRLWAAVALASGLGLAALALTDKKRREF